MESNTNTPPILDTSRGLNDLYRSGYYRYYAKAQCRAKDPISGHVLSKFETVEIESTVLVPISNNRQDVKEIALSGLHSHYSQIIKLRTRDNLALKKKIGGIHWETETIDFVLKIYKDRIYSLGEINVNQGTVSIGDQSP